MSARRRVGRLTLGGVEYVVIPRDEYVERLGCALPDALAYATASVAADLLAARKASGLSQVQLAAELRKSQTTVSRAETGSLRVGERYVAEVLAACGLPSGWRRGRRPRKVGQS